jgi:hypothetical protein
MFAAPGIMLMSLAWNTKQIVAARDGKTVGGRDAVEYHLRTSRELYDAAIISADRHHSSAGRWAFKQEKPFYSVEVVTYPTYALPQELCVSFDCYTRTIQTANSTSSGPPVDEVAFEFTALLSLLTREPIAPLGARRIDDLPTVREYLYQGPQRRQTPAPPCAINSGELRAILEGLGQSTDEPTINAAISATKLYYAALSLAPFDISGAYLSLVSALECLAGHHYAKKTYAFADVPKFQNLEPLLTELREVAGDDTLASKLESALMQGEHFLIKKFRLLVADFLPQEFWTTADDINPQIVPQLAIEEPDLSKKLGAVYNARSKYVHAGTPFPPYVQIGIGDRVPVSVVVAALDTATKKVVPPFVPPFVWFERLSHFVIVEYFRRAFAPTIVKKRETRTGESERIQAVVKSLPENVRECLRKLVDWTTRWLGYAIINPSAANKTWADDAASITILRTAGLIGATSETMEGSSWLKNREVGEAVGAFFFGAMNNPLRGNELLLPALLDDDFGDPGDDSVQD